MMNVDLSGLVFGLGSIFWGGVGVLMVVIALIVRGLSEKDRNPRAVHRAMSVFYAGIFPAAAGLIGISILGADFLTKSGRNALDVFMFFESIALLGVIIGLTITRNRKYIGLKERLSQNDVLDDVTRN